MSHQEVSTTLEKLVTSEVQEGTRQSTACLVRLVRYVSPHHLSQDRPLMFRSARVAAASFSPVGRWKTCKPITLLSCELASNDHMMRS